MSVAISGLSTIESTALDMIESADDVAESPDVTQYRLDGPFDDPALDVGPRVRAKLAALAGIIVSVDDAGDTSFRWFRTEAGFVAAWEDVQEATDWGYVA